jgi:hypothetical protein
MITEAKAMIHCGVTVLILFCQLLRKFAFKSSFATYISLHSKVALPLYWI